MTWKNSVERWGAVSQAFHWLIVVLVVVMAYLGLTMTDLPNSPHKVSLYALHKSIGLTILALVALRLLWRGYAGAPLALAGIPRWQRRAASWTHGALYALLFAMPLSGWVVNSAAGFPLQWFKLFKVPAITHKDAAVHALARSTHEALFWTLVAVVMVHAGAALLHHLVWHDDTLARMLPRRWLHVRTNPPRPFDEDANRA